MSVRPGRRDVGTCDGSFSGFVGAAAARGELVVQPRMGFSDPGRMRAGLLATRNASATSVGTITLDSYTRTGDLAAARTALATGIPLNGYPITSHSLDVTRGVLDGVREGGFPVQVRHGSPTPRAIVRAMVRLGLDATEGGPVSYCFPYGAVPLHDSISEWTESCRILAGSAEHGLRPHLETFGGAMMGQLCPPGLLVALSVLEAMFFRQNGVHDVSLSYAQQTSPDQDADGIAALRTLAADLLGNEGWHVVVYAYMGLFPRTAAGSRLLGEAAVRLAVRTGAQRIIVKTPAESTRIPTIEENVAALEHSAIVASTLDEAPAPTSPASDNEVYAEAAALVHAVLDLSEDIGEAIGHAFRRGYLDVPFCLHPNNPGRARSFVGPDGRLAWSAIGAMPLRGVADVSPGCRMTSGELMTSLRHVADRFDDAVRTRDVACSGGRT